LLIGMDRLGTRMAVESAYRSYRFGKWAPGIGGATIVLLIVAGGWFLTNKNTERNADHMNTVQSAAQIQTGIAATGLNEADDPEEEEVETEPSDDSILGTISPPGPEAEPEASIMFFAVPEIQEQKDSIAISSVQDELEAQARSYKPEAYPPEYVPRLIQGITAPEYPGGEIEMRKFIYANLKIPEEARKSGTMEQVMVRFTVDGEGNVTSVEAEPGPGKAYEEEAERVIKAMPKWKPGTEYGEPVDIQMALPLIFMARMERM
jgi:periplasmic protein TonB